LRPAIANFSLLHGVIEDLRGMKDRFGETPKSARQRRALTGMFAPMRVFLMALPSLRAPAYQN
jgi:hypothetical protein